MTPPPPLRRAVAWTAIANAVYLGSQYGVLITIAKLGSTTMVGEYALALAIVTPFIVLTQMQLRQVFVTDVHGSVPFVAFFWTRAASGVLAVLGSVGLVVLLGYGRDFVLLTTLLGLAKLFESQSDIVYANLQRHERMQFVALSMVLRGILGLVCVITVLWTGGSLLGAAAAFAGVGALLLLVVDIPLFRRTDHAAILAWRWQWAVVLPLIRTSAPLTAASFLGSVAASVPRYFLEYFHGRAAVGLFAVATMPISLMGLFSGALAQATLARAAVYLQRGYHAAFRSLAIRLALFNVLLGAGIVLLLSVAGDALVRLLFTPEYEPVVPLMVILSAAVAMNGLASFGSIVVTAGRQFRMQLATDLIGLGVQLPAFLLLVPGFGALGAAWGEFVRFSVTAAFLQIVGLRLYRRVFVRMTAPVPLMTSPPNALS